MEVQLSSEQESRILRIAEESGRSVDEIVHEMFDWYLAEDDRFRAAVQVGIDAADRGDFVPAAEVWANVERALKP
jgi:predicted transcriptional regulator